MKTPPSKSPKAKPGKVDKALGQLPQEDIEEFQRMARANASRPELRDFLSERGFQMSLMAITTWWKRNRPTGKEVVALNTWAEQFRGADEDYLLELTAGLTGNLVKILYDEYDSDNVSGNVKLQSLLEAIRELRQITETITGKERQRQEEELTFNGAIALKTHLEKTFKNTSFAEPLALAIDSFLTETYSA